MIAASRALESRRRDRLFDDPYAELLLRGLSRPAPMPCRPPRTGRRPKRNTSRRHHL
ncbi:unnamed protein product [Ectocarpus sp. 12 AP-2014]